MKGIVSMLTCKGKAAFGTNSGTFPKGSCFFLFDVLPVSVLLTVVALWTSVSVGAVTYTVRQDHSSCARTIPIRATRTRPYNTGSHEVLT